MDKGKFSEEKLLSSSMAAAAAAEKRGELSEMVDVPSMYVWHRRAKSVIVTLQDEIEAEIAEEEALFAMFDVVEEGKEEVEAGEGEGPSSSSAVAEGARRHQYSQSVDETAIAAVMVGSSGGAGGSGSGAAAADGAGGSGGGDGAAAGADGSGGSGNGGGAAAAGDVDGGGVGGVRRTNRKGMSAAELAVLAASDPKRYRRILANRQSAARSKERKLKEKADLEDKIKSLQAEGASLSAEFALVQRDTSNLTAENDGLKWRLEATEREVKLQEGLLAADKDEFLHLKMLTEQAIANSGLLNFPSSSAGNQPFPSNDEAMLMLAIQQFQQLQMNSQEQQQPHQPVLAQQSGDSNAGPSMTLSKDKASDPNSGASKD